MKEKYINKILNFSSDIICNAEEIVINKEQVKGIVKELQENYMQKTVIRQILTQLKDEICGNDEYLGEKQSMQLDLLKRIEQDLLGGRYQGKNKVKKC